MVCLWTWTESCTGGGCFCSCTFIPREDVNREKKVCPRVNLEVGMDWKTGLLCVTVVVTSPSAYSSCLLSEDAVLKWRLSEV